MAACLVPDQPAVNITLEHLEELDTQLRAEGVAFSPEASHHLRETADAIKELEALRKAAHEELEVETIETGKLRHRLLSQRDGIISEISAAVTAARAANAAEFSHLQTETTNTVQEIELMEKRRKLLDEQNVLLLPEHQRLDGFYTELIKQLNRQLSEKALTQIRLKEARKQIQTTREKITRVHSIRKDLQENLMRERRQFKESKRMLEKEIEETMCAVHEQTKTNTEMQNLLGVALTELLRKEERVVEPPNQISLLEKRSDRLKARQQEQEEHIKNKMNKSDELTEQRERHEKELEELRETQNRQLLRLQENIKAVDREIEEEQRKSSVRLEALSNLSSMLQAQRKKEEETQINHKRLKKDFEKRKQRLDEHFASIAKSKREIKQMEQQIKHLRQAIDVEMWKRNLVELQTQLDKEKQSRASFELEKEELCVGMETLEEHHRDSVRKLRSAISFHKTRYSELTEEKEKLQQQEVLSSLTEELTHRISKAEEEHKQTEIEYSNEIQRLNTQAKSVARACLDEEQELKDQEVILSEVEAQFNINHSQHQAFEQQTTELNDIRSHLELSIQEAKERTTATLQSKEDLQKELQTSRDYHTELLRSSGEQIVAVEENVSEKEQMLEQVKMENSRLHLCIEHMKMDVVNARKEKEKNTQEMSWMKEEVQSIYRRLVEAWSKDKLSSEESAEKDQTLLDAMQMFRLQVQERKQHMEDVNVRLEAELKTMSTLLEISNSQHK